MDGDGDVGWSRKRDVTEWRNRDGQEQRWTGAELADEEREGKEG